MVDAPVLGRAVPGLAVLRRVLGLDVVGREVVVPYVYDGYEDPPDTLFETDWFMVIRLVEELVEIKLVLRPSTFVLEQRSPRWGWGGSSATRRVTRLKWWIAGHVRRRRVIPASAYRYRLDQKLSIPPGDMYEKSHCAKLLNEPCITVPTQSLQNGNPGPAPLEAPEARSNCEI